MLVRETPDAFDSPWKEALEIYLRSILELYRLVDWLLRLPEELDQAYKQQLREFEQSRVMPYITSMQRQGREEGRVLALREGILDIIDARFGEAPVALRERVNELEDEVRLKALHRLAVTCPSLADFERSVLS